MLASSRGWAYAVNFVNGIRDKVLERSRPFPTEYWIMGAEPKKQSVGRGALTPPRRNKKMAESREIIRKRMAAFSPVRDVEDAVPYR